VTSDQLLELTFAASVLVFLAYSFIHVVHLWRSGRGRHPLRALLPQAGFTEVARSGVMSCDACNQLVEYREEHLHRCPAMIVELRGESNGDGGDGEEQSSVSQTG
jgi:hypothetical protein